MENQLKKYRTDKKMTQAQLAEQVYVSKRTIISIEKGVYSPGLLLAYRLAKTLEIDLLTLFSLEKNYADFIIEMEGNYEKK